MLSFLMITMPVCAASMSNEELVVTLNTDKEEYLAGEHVTITGVVENISDEVCENITIQSIIPDGFVVVDGSTEEFPRTLNAGEQYSYQLVIMKENNIPESDDTKEEHFNNDMGSNQEATKKEDVAKKEDVVKKEDVAVSSEEDTVTEQQNLVKKVKPNKTEKVEPDDKDEIEVTDQQETEQKTEVTDTTQEQIIIEEEEVPTETFMEIEETDTGAAWVTWLVLAVVICIAVALIVVLVVRNRKKRKNYLQF